MMSVRSKRVISAIICVSILLCCATPSFAAVVDSSNVVSFFEKMFDDNESYQDPEVLSVNELINGIGKAEYTDDHLSKISAAESAYDSLKDAQKEKVSDYASLTAARYAYNALAADNVDTGSLTVIDGGQIGDLKWSVYSNGLLEISGSGAVPSYYTGSAPWYGYASAITGIIVRSSVTGIGSKAFYGCNYVKEITLPFIGESREAVGYSSHLGYIFDYDLVSSGSCNYGTTGKIGDVYKVDSSENVYYFTSTSGYKKYTFSVPSRLRTVTVTDADKIHDGAFAFCDNITVVVLNEGVTFIGGWSFYETGIQDFALSSTVTYIGESAFSGCTGLYEMHIPNGVDRIEDRTFYGCTGIKKLTLGNNIGSIGDEAFAYCSGIEQLNIPDGVWSIGKSAFYRCGKISSIVIPDSVFSLGSSAFGYCSSATWLSIGSGLENIPQGAFEYCTGLTEVTVPNTVESIGSKAFYGCNYVKEITLPFIGESREAVGYSSHLGYAFANCPLLLRVAMSKVETIGDYAFCNDIAIDKIDLGTRLCHIGDHAFDSCKSLPSVVLPETVREIGAYSFYDCNNMRSANIPAGVTAIKEYTFFGCASLLEISLPDTVLSVGDYAYYGCVLAEDLYLGSSLETIGAYAFYNCNKVKEIVFPNTLTHIGNYAFRSCSSITEISVPDSVTEFGDCVFYACTGLVKGEFGYGITSIGNSEFYGCVNFKKLLLLGRVDHIHELAFYGAEDTAIYTFRNLYVKDYCDENYLEYHELDGDCTAIVTPPIKTEYYEFEELDLTGLSIAVTYSDGTERTVTSGYTVGGYDSSVIGKQTVVVDYHGISQSFDVIVVQKEILSISVTSASPLKVTKGEDIDMSKAVITVNYSDGTSRVIDSGYELEGFDKNAIGKQTVSLTFRGVRCDVAVTVGSNLPGDTNNDGKLTSMDILIFKMVVSGVITDGDLYSADNADIDGDGKLTGRDVLLTRMIISGKY